MRILIFLSIFFLITGLISFYIFIRGLQAIPPGSSLRNAYIILFWTIVVSFVAGRAMENHVPSFLSDALIWMGSFWIAAMLYFLLAVILLDLVRLINHFTHLYPAFIVEHYRQAKYVTGGVVAGLVGIVLLAGHINAVIPRTLDLKISIPGKTSKLKQMNIVAVTDIHLGVIVGRSRCDDIVNRINSMDPDVVLLPGDIVDEDLQPIIRQNLGESLRNIKSRFGVFAITGNHEYIGGVNQAITYLTEHNITMLRDESVKVADSFYLVGRDDRSRTQFANLPPRKDLAELMMSVDRSYPVILMDHQPFGLSEAADQGIDFQISGHTHYGQLWPISYIVKRVYELPWGYKRKSQTQYYVSDGVGTWGPPVRIGNRPEIIHMQLRFD